MALKCAKCNRTVNTRTENHVTCHRDCKGSFHLVCAGISEETYDGLVESGNVESWTCTACSSKFLEAKAAVNKNPSVSSLNTYISTDQLKNMMNNIVKEHVDNISQLFIEHIGALTLRVTELESKISDLTSENIILKSEFEKLNLTLKSGKNSDIQISKGVNKDELNAKLSYAESLVKKSQKTVIVQPKDKTQSVSKTKSDVLNAIDPLNSSLDIIGRVKPLKDGGLLLGCENTKSFKQIAKGKFADDYEIREVKSIRPTIRITGFSDDIDEENFLLYLKKQNESIFDVNSSVNLLKLSCTKRNNTVYQALIEVDLYTYKRALGVGHCLIGLDGCSIYDAVEVTRCYNCNNYGHASKNCKNKTSCPKCAGEHKLVDCRSDSFKCCNCSKYLESLATDEFEVSDVTYDHAAWDYKQCTLFRKTMDKIKCDIFGSAI